MTQEDILRFTAGVIVAVNNDRALHEPNTGDPTPVHHEAVPFPAAAPQAAPVPEVNPQAVHIQPVHRAPEQEWDIVRPHLPGKLGMPQMKLTERAGSAVLATIKGHPAKEIVFRRRMGHPYEIRPHAWGSFLAALKGGYKAKCVDQKLDLVKRNRPLPSASEGVPDLEGIAGSSRL